VTWFPTPGMAHLGIRHRGEGDRWGVSRQTAGMGGAVRSCRGTGVSGGRLGASGGRRLEEIGLQGGAGLPVKGGQNSRERPGPRLCRLPGLK
jgi:hypothetical protein